MSTTYSQTSPYFATQLFDGKFLDVMNMRSIPRLADDILTQIGPSYDLRPDLLSYDLYTTPALWWVFAARNPNTLTDPLWSFRSGVYIYVPQRRSLIQALGV